MRKQLFVLVGGALLLSVFGCKVDIAGYNRCIDNNKLTLVFLEKFQGNLSSKLSITDENVSSILPNAFNDLKYVTLLSLQFAENKILDLQPQSFNGLPNLQHLYISSGIVALEENLFASVSNTLIALLLRINGTNPKLSNGLSILVNLEQLVIENTVLNNIDNKTFENLSGKINSLELNNNSLVSIEPNAFSPLANLQTLIIYNNKLSNVDASTFAGLPRLISLSIIKNNLNIIRQNTFGKMKYISFLNFASNNISKIENAAFLNLVLDELVLRDNRLTVIEEYNFKNLTVGKLNLAGNDKLSRINNREFLDARITHLILPEAVKMCCEKNLLFVSGTITYVKNYNKFSN